MARIWGPPIYTHVRQPFPDCTRCRLPQSAEQRVLWGCDARADRAVFSVGCSVCNGGDLSCRACGGRGSVDIYRCPSGALAEASPSQNVAVDLLVRSYIQYSTRNVLPAEGAWLDQTRSWATGIEILEAEKSRLEGLLHDYQQKQQEAARRKQAANAKKQHGRR